MKVPVFSFPWICWKCKKEMMVAYPDSADVFNTIYKGNLALTYSRAQNRQVVGNLCPNCGALQGNTYVRFKVIPAGSYQLEKHVVGFFDVPVECEKCGRAIEDLTDDLFLMLYYYDEYLCKKRFQNPRLKANSNLQEEFSSSPWICRSCREVEQAERDKAIKEEREEERIRRNREGPVVQCPLCKANTKENPETRFIEHHLSYSPEVKITVCLSCNNKIHQTNQYPDLKPKDKRVSRKETKALREAKLQLELKRGIPSDEFCVVCLKRFKKGDLTIIYGRYKIHTKCVPKRKIWRAP